MQIPERKLDLVFRIITLVTLALITALGAIMVLFVIKPFWVDEWFIIYNLKTRDVGMLMGPMALMQQFPRAYLILVKLFTQSLDYNYFSLRLPSFLVSVAFMALAYRMESKLFPGKRYTIYLFVMILISSPTFTEYYVQTKQYTMDILLGVVVLWQLHRLLQIEKGLGPTSIQYALLCASFIVLPFFSYTYPIEVAPLFGVTLMFLLLRGKGDSEQDITEPVWRALVPLALGAISLAVCYFVETKQLMADRGMHVFWNFLMVDQDHLFRSFFVSFYTVFAQVGSGLFFEVLFGVLGITSFLFGLWACYRCFKARIFAVEEKFVLYACLLLLGTFTLFLLGKVPLGTPRLNAFTVPSIAILIIYFLDRTSIYLKNDLLKALLPGLLLVWTAGNVFSKYTNYFSSATYKKQMEVYINTSKAISQAQAEKIPMLVTKGVAAPYEVAAYPEGAPEQGVWVVKTFPAYHMAEQVSLYPIETMEAAKDAVEKLPASITSVIIGDGINYRKVSRN